MAPLQRGAATFPAAAIRYDFAQIYRGLAQINRGLVPVAVQLPGNKVGWWVL
jgi:hypothetical protein